MRKIFKLPVEFDVNENKRKKKVVFLTHEQIAKTRGDFLFPKDDSDGKISQIDELFQAVIDNIDDRLGDAEGVYNAANKNAVNDGEIDSKFTAFSPSRGNFRRV
jgi:hypothetical protein